MAIDVIAVGEQDVDVDEVVKIVVRATIVQQTKQHLYPMLSTCRHRQLARAILIYFYSKELFCCRILEIG